MVNYLILHYCGMGGQAWISVPVLVGVLILAFYVLAETAENYFSPVVQKSVEVLGMTPSMGGVTLLALGNGAPDIFASLAAIQGDNSRIGFSAILSAGTFVSGFVVGLVALASGPFSVQPMPFVRDVSFYFGAVCLLFMVYLNGEIVFWQAIGMVSFYVLFVVVVICTNQKRLDPVDRITSVSDAIILDDSGSMQKITSEDKRVLGVLGNVQDVTEDQVSNEAVTLVVSSPQSGATGPFNKDILSRCQELLTGICRRLEGHSQTDEVCISFSIVLEGLVTLEI
jgi:Ca2+/Na+ antiporter